MRDLAIVTALGRSQPRITLVTILKSSSSSLDLIKLSIPVPLESVIMIRTSFKAVLMVYTGGKPGIINVETGR